MYECYGDLFLVVMGWYGMGNGPLRSYNQLYFMLLIWVDILNK